MALNSFNKFLCGAGCVTAPNVFLALNSYNLALSKSLEAEEKIKEQQKQEIIAQKIIRLEDEIKEKNETIEVTKEQLANVRNIVQILSKSRKIYVSASNGLECEIERGNAPVYLELGKNNCIEKKAK